MMNGEYGKWKVLRESDIGADDILPFHLIMIQLMILAQFHELSS
jgi:hypothetical protein